MNARRYFVRLFSSGITNWFEDNPNIESLAKVFDLKKEEQSVYEVADGEEECLAAAAHKLTDPWKNPDAVSVLRIDGGELPGYGIRLDAEQFGTTGIPRWDCRHRNLLADRQLVAFVRFLAGRCYRGHDQVRRIEKRLLIRALHTIRGYPPSHCPDHVKLIAQWCLNSDKNTRPYLSLDQMEREVMALEFEDEVIRPRAELLEERGRDRRLV